jgi:hypothetical protein
MPRMMYSESPGPRFWNCRPGHAAGESFEGGVALQREVVTADGVDRFGGLLDVRLAALGRGHDNLLQAMALGGVRRKDRCAGSSAKDSYRTAALDFPARSHDPAPHGCRERVSKY